MIRDAPLDLAALRRGAEEARKDIATWPQWKKNAVRAVAGIANAGSVTPSFSRDWEEHHARIRKGEVARMGALVFFDDGCEYDDASLRRAGEALRAGTFQHCSRPPLELTGVVPDEPAAPPAVLRWKSKP